MVVRQVGFYRRAKRATMSRTAVELLDEFLKHTLDADTIRRLVAPDATYVSLNQRDRDLHRIMPWCGTHERGGPQGIIDTFATVAEFWKIDEFTVDQLFGSGEFAAAFGRFTYTSTVAGRTVTSPFAILTIAKNDRITYMQFMEDTFATAASFQTGGNATYHSDPHGEAIAIAGPPTI
jgi:uncharacterized protein